MKASTLRKVLCVITELLMLPLILLLLLTRAAGRALDIGSDRLGLLLTYTLDDLEDWSNQ